MSVTGFLVLFVGLPVIWSGLVRGVRRLCLSSGHPGEKAERLFLLLMVSPVFLAMAVLAVPDLFAGVTMPLPEMGGFGEGGFGPAEGAAAEIHREIRWGALLALGLAGIYGGGILLGLGRLGLGIGRVFAIARHADAQDTDILVTEARISPFALPGGKMVLPRYFVDDANTDELCLIVAHERAHIRRRDPVWFLVLAALDAVFWVSPFLRKQTKACRLAAELACDDAVTRAAPQMRKAYAATLIRVLKHAAGHAPTCAPAVFSPKTQGDYQVRLSTIMRPEPVRRNRRAVLALMALALALVPMAVVQGAYAGNALAPAFTVRPVEGRLTSQYGMRPHPVTGEQKFHKGTDIAAPSGTPIYAPAGGKVLRVVMSDKGYGNMLELDHGDGVITRYAQLRSVEADGKPSVRAGDLIARVGASGQATGPHLHIEVIIDGKHVDPETVLDLPKKDGAPHAH